MDAMDSVDCGIRSPVAGSTFVVDDDFSMALIVLIICGAFVAVVGRVVSMLIIWSSVDAIASVTACVGVHDFD